MFLCKKKKSVTQSGHMQAWQEHRTTQGFLDGDARLGAGEKCDGYPLELSILGRELLLPEAAVT